MCFQIYRQHRKVIGLGAPLEDSVTRGTLDDYVKDILPIIYGELKYKFFGGWGIWPYLHRERPLI